VGGKENAITGRVHSVFGQEDEVQRMSPRITAEEGKQRGGGAFTKFPISRADDWQKGYFAKEVKRREGERKLLRKKALTKRGGNRGEKKRIFLSGGESTLKKKWLQDGKRLSL